MSEKAKRAHDRRPPTSDKLRSDIDHGRTGDKIGFPDPSAAPLGTDDEAAGTPPSPEQLRRAAEAEAQRPTETRSASLRHRPVSAPGNAQLRGRTILLWSAALALVLIVGALALWL